MFRCVKSPLITGIRRRKCLSVLAITLLSIFLTACSKDDDVVPEGETYMTAEIGGRQTDLSFELWARKDQEGGYNLTIVGHNGEYGQGKETEHIQLAIFDSAEEITDQTYQMDVAAGGYSMLVTYGIVKEDGTQINYTASEQSASPYDSFEIKITSIDGKYVKGTFKGKVSGGSAAALSVIEITKGEFSAPVRED